MQPASEPQPHPHPWRKTAFLFVRRLLESLRDLLPVVLVVTLFQVVIVQQPLPEEVSLLDLLLGLGFVVVGLTLFVQGLQQGLFPLGESLAQELVSRGSAFWLFLFAFTLGFGSTIAEPALIAVAGKAAAMVAEAGMIGASDEAQARFALEHRLVVALSVGVAVMLGVLRILKGWSLPLIIISGYVVVLALTLLAPDEIVGIAYDSGGVTTSTITVPLVTALGVGLATVIKGRNPVLDGFGLIALASVMPIIFVLIFGIVRV